MDMAAGLSRRNFLAGMGSALVLRRSAFANAGADGELPACYRPYLDGIARKVAADAAKGADRGFVFLTDPHVMSNFGHSGFAIADIVRRTGLTRVIGGGDWSMAFCGTVDPKTYIDETYARMNLLWRDPIEAVGGRFFTAKGNHDMIVWSDRSRSNGYMYASAKTREMLMATKESAFVTVNPDEKSGLYFYHDDVEDRIRYIVADTSDGVLENDRAGRGGWGYGNFMRPDQLRWIGDVALGTVPAGYEVVVAHHIPLTPFTGIEREAAVLSDFRLILEAYQVRGRINTKMAGMFDFSFRKGGDIVFDISGHTHSDEFAYYNGILHISEICDAWNGESRTRTPFSGVLFKSREERRGTVKEQGFDIVAFGKDVVRTTRIGIGQDRVFHLKPTTLKIGDKIRLESAEYADVEWKCFDSWEVKQDRTRKKPEELWTFFNRIAEISPDGVVTAKSPGWATALAIAPDFRKEIFGIKVEG